MKNDKKSEIENLRQKALELQKKKKTKTALPLSEIEMLKMLHELEVHQIELELQNEELQQAKVVADIATDKYTDLYDFAPSGYFTLSSLGNIIEMNLTSAGMLGRDRSNIISKRFSLFVSTNTLSIFNLFFEKIFESKKKETCELVLIKDDKTSIYVLLTGIFTETEENCNITMVDITERKQEEEKLELSNTRYEHLIQSLDEGFLRADAQGYITKANIPITKMCGYTSPNEMLGVHMTNLYALPSDRDAMLKEINDKGILRNYELHLRKKNGEKFWCLNNINLITDESGKILGTEGIIRDITQRKKTEAALKESEEKYKALYYNAPLSYQSLDIDGNFLDVNPSWLKTLGYTKEEVIGNRFSDFLHPDYIEHFRKNFPEFKKQGYIHDAKFKIKHKNGNILDISFEGCIGYTPEGKFKQTYCTFKDITEQKIVEEALVESEKNLKEAQRVSHVGSWDLNILTGELFWSDEAYRIYGFKPQEFAPTFEKFTSILYPEDREYIQQNVDAALDGSKDYDIDFRFVLPNGKVGWVHCEGEVTCNEQGEAIRFFGTQIDITERKQAEEELRASESKYKKVSDNSPAVLYQFLMTPEGETSFTYVSDVVETILGLSAKDIVRDQSKFMDIVHPDDVKMYQEEIMKATETLESFPIIFRCLKDGEVVWVEAHGKPTPKINGSIIWDGFLLDITERKQASEKLLLYKKIIEESKDAIAIIDKQGFYLEQNKAHKSLIGYSDEELKGKTPAIHFGDEAFIKIANELSEKNNFRGELISHAKSGDIDIDLSAFSVLDDNGEVICHVGLKRDISEQKKAGEKIRDAEERYHTLFDQSPDGICINDSETLMPIMFNDAACRILGYSHEEFSKLSIRDYEHSETEEDTLKHIQKIKDKGWDDFESKYKTKDGKIIDVFVKTRTIQLSGNIYFNVLFSDITEKKLANDALKESEQSRRILFDYAPIPIWDEDFSMVKKEFDNLKEKGIEDFRTYFDNNPDEVNRLANLVKIIAVNEKSNEFYGVDSITQLTTKLTDWFDEDSFLTFKNELIALAEGKTKYESEIKINNLNGKTIYLHLSLNIPPSSIKTLDRVIVSFLDITERKQADELLNSQNIKLFNAKDLAEKSEEQIKIQLKNIDFLRRTASQFVNDSYDSDIYTYIGNCIKEIIPDAYILLSEIDKQDIIPKAIIGIGSLSEKIMSLVGQNPIGKRFNYDEDLIDLSGGSIKKFNGSIRSLFLNSISKTISTSIGKLINIGNIYGVAFIVNHKIYANAAIIFPKGKSIQNIEIIETFVKQSSLALKRKREEKELLNHRENLEQLVNSRSIELEKKAKKVDESQIAMRYLLEDANDTRKELANSNTKLLESNQDLESFAYSVSHDLKSPLRAINGYTNVLLEDFPGIFIDEKKEFLDLVIKNSQKMNTLIDDLLRFSRVGRNELDKSEFDLSIMFKDVLNQQSEISTNKNIKHKIQENIMVHADLAAIKQVLSNLVGNAIKFSSRNKEIYIEFGKKDMNQKETYYIKDNGIGFDEKYKDKLFGVFQRLQSSEKFEGTGVGLALVKRILNKHGGDIWAESKTAKGSTFYFTVS